MKIVAASTGATLESTVDQRFGRASMFIVYDTDTKQHEAIDNKQNVHAVQGAGIQAAEIVARQKPVCLLAGHCGPKAFKALQTAGIPVFIGIQTTVADAIQQYIAGTLKPSKGPDVEGGAV